MWESKDRIKKLINWDKPPKNGDGAWHAKIRLIEPDGEEFTKTLQSIPTTRKLSERESPREIIDLDHFYGTSKLEYKFQDQENSEDIFSFGSALEDFICVVFVLDRNISIQKKSIREHDRRVLQDYLLKIDSRLNKGEGLSDDLPNHAKTFHDLGVIDRTIPVDLAQKAKVKWAIEGDENSKFFYGIVNKKRRQQAIKGILVDGEWIDNPDRVKREFYNHFTNRFSAPYWSRVLMEGIFPKCLGADSSHDLDGNISNDEIKKAEQALLFKVDFQNAFNSVRWDHLDDILALVLVNGSPTDEFLFHRGLRQGDPLSPFSFILVMESLHVAFQWVIDRGMFVHILVGKNNLLPISHLFYADDAMFIDFQSMANSFGCLANNLPFTYLGVKVAANMASINLGNEDIQKVTSKLSKWKAISLSVGGRLTLLKLVLGSLPTYYMTLFKAPDGVLSHLEWLHNSFFLGAKMDERKMTWVCSRKVMAQKQYGGLGLNVIKAIHGSNGSIDQPPLTCTGCSTWIMIHKAVANLKSKGMDILGLFNLDLQKDASVAKKFQNPDFATHLPGNRGLMVFSLQPPKAFLGSLVLLHVVPQNVESNKEARFKVQDLASGEIVSLNILSRTRKLGHSTRKLRSLL
ncbi:RNA-directed DNA polymerase, eukaryota [Tanacetum coccineum]